MAKSGKYIGNGPVTNFKLIADLTSNNVFFSDGTLNPHSQPFFQTNPTIYRLNASRGSRPGSTLPFDIINIDNTSPALARPGAFVRFSIEQSKFEKPLTQVGSNVAPNLALRTRGSSIYEERTSVTTGEFTTQIKTIKPRSYPWEVMGGLHLTSSGEHNDLVIPYGIGSRDYVSNTITERGITYINSGGGNDVIIGGYGQDFFGARELDQLLSLKEIKSSYQNNTGGSKLFVGGSSNDVLDGSKGKDFLVGDRLNGYELYLPSSALGTIPLEWADQINSIKKYQDPGYTNGSGAGQELLGNTPGKFSGTRQYPLWVPGNDIIRGYDDNDIIYGDDNTMDLNLKQLSVIRSKLSETPSAVLNLGGGINSELWNRDGFKLAADFIHGGAGRDQIFGGVGADAIIGGGDSDVINLGPQVIVSGYNPFFGPKVAYGDDAFYDELTGKWQKNQASASPDLFVVGRLFSELTDLEKSNSGDIPALSIESKNVADKLAGFESAWKLAGKAVKAIPRVGSIISGVVTAATKLLKLQDPKPTPPGKPAKALDAITIIKDFDPTDMITFNLLRGQVVDYDKGSLSIAASDKDNPLIGDLAISNGARIILADNAGTFYTRVFLQDVQDLYFLAQTPSEDGSSISITLGGSAFGEVLNDAGSRLYQPVVF